MSGSTPYGTCVGKGVVTICALAVNHELEMIVEQSGREGHTGCISCHIVGFENTVLVAISE